MREGNRRIAVLGNHIPRRCGIATFTSDFVQALSRAYSDAEIDVYAINDGKEYAYPASVKGSIEAEDLEAYRNLADHLNSEEYDAVCIQHEFGIFGGDSGCYLLELMRNVKMPIVTILHTILTHPSEKQRSVFQEILQLSERVAAMSQKGVQILQGVYGVSERQIALIHHGIRDTDPEKGRLLRKVHDIGDRKMILTFGLLSQDKGIQHMVAAMPAIVASHPDAIYCVVGATHPNIKQQQGEAHRESLVALAEELGVSNNLKFVDRFVSDQELAGWLAASDIYVTPYLKPEQIVSGTLAYALGGGNAVVSTPYWYAEELLADGRGILVRFRDPSALATSIVGLLDDAGLRQTLARKGFDFGRAMKWDQVGLAYKNLVEATLSENCGLLRLLTAEEPVQAMVKISYPSLDHLLSLTDDTGVVQHATYRFANRNEGYCSDDNARALEFCLLAEGIVPEATLEKPRNTYLEFLMHAFDPEIGRFRNFMGYSRIWLDEGSDDCQGRVMKALAKASATEDADISAVASEYFLRGLPILRGSTSPRTWAHGILACSAYLAARTDDRVATEMKVLAQRLTFLYGKVEQQDWLWFERSLTYENAVLSQAMIEAGYRLRSPVATEIGLNSLRWLLKVQTSHSGVFAPIGSLHPYEMGGRRPWFDQQPIEVAATVSACLTALRTTMDKTWEDEASRAYRWFLGDNIELLSMVDRESGRGFDGLQRGGVNQNSGAESTLAYLSSALELASLSLIKNRARLA